MAYIKYSYVKHSPFYSVSGQVGVSQMQDKLGNMMSLILMSRLTSVMLAECQAGHSHSASEEDPGSGLHGKPGSGSVGLVIQGPGRGTGTAPGCAVHGLQSGWDLIKSEVTKQTKKEKNYETCTYYNSLKENMRHNGSEGDKFWIKSMQLDHFMNPKLQCTMFLR